MASAPPFNALEALTDPYYIGGGIGAARRRYEIARLASELSAAAGRHQPGGLIPEPQGGGLLGFLGRGLSQFGNAALLTIPSTFYLGAATANALGSTWGHGDAGPLRQNLESMYHGIGQDIHDPIGRPGYLGMDILGAATLGRAAVARGAGFARGFRLGEVAPGGPEFTGTTVEPVVPTPRPPRVGKGRAARTAPALPGHGKPLSVELRPGEAIPMSEIAAGKYSEHPTIATFQEWLPDQPVKYQEALAKVQEPPRSEVVVNGRNTIRWEAAPGDFIDLTMPKGGGGKGTISITHTDPAGNVTPIQDLPASKYNFNAANMIARTEARQRALVAEGNPTAKKIAKKGPLVHHSQAFAENAAIHAEQQMKPAQERPAGAEPANPLDAEMYHGYSHHLLDLVEQMTNRGSAARPTKVSTIQAKLGFETPEEAQRAMEVVKLRKADKQLLAEKQKVVQPEITPSVETDAEIRARAQKVAIKQQAQARGTRQAQQAQTRAAKQVAGEPIKELFPDLQQIAVDYMKRHPTAGAVRLKNYLNTHLKKAGLPELDIHPTKVMQATQRAAKAMEEKKVEEAAKFKGVKAEEIKKAQAAAQTAKGAARSASRERQLQKAEAGPKPKEQTHHLVVEAAAEILADAKKKGIKIRADALKRQATIRAKQMADERKLPTERTQFPGKPTELRQLAERQSLVDLPDLVEAASHGNKAARQEIARRLAFNRKSPDKEHEVAQLEHAMESVKSALKGEPPPLKPGAKPPRTKPRDAGTDLRSRKESPRQQGKNPRGPKGVRVTMKLEDGSVHEADFKTLPRTWKSAAMNKLPYGADKRGITFEKSPITEGPVREGLHTVSESVEAAPKPVEAPPKTESKPAPATGVKKSTPKERGLTPGQLESAGVPHADQKAMIEMLNEAFDNAEAAGTKPSLSDLAEVFTMHMGEEAGNSAFRVWSAPRGGASGVPFGARLKAGLSAAIRPPEPGVFLHRREVFKQELKGGGERMIEYPVYTAKSRSALVRDVQHIKYGLLQNPERALIPKFAQGWMRNMMERHIKKEGAHLKEIAKSEVALKDLQERAQERWIAGGKKGSLADEINKELQAVIKDVREKRLKNKRGNEVVDYIDTSNQLAVIGALLLKPAYLSANILGQAEIAMVDHAWNPYSIIRSVALQRATMKHYPETHRQIFFGVRDAGAMGSFGHERGLTHGKVGAVGRTVNKAYRGLSLEGFSAFGRGFKKGAKGGITFGKGGKVWPGYEWFLDNRWRENAFFNEARRQGFRTPEQIHALLTEDRYSGRRMVIFQRASRNAIEYGRLGPKERDWIRRVVFFYPWIKASTRWTLRSFTEHPVSTQLRYQGTRYAQKKINEDLGPLPSYLTGAFKVGSVEDKVLGKRMPLIFNPAAVTSAGSAGQVAQAVGEMASGSKASTAHLAQFFNPTVSSAIAVSTGKDPFSDTDINPSGGFKVGGHTLIPSVPGTFVNQFLQSVSPATTVGDISRLQALRRGEGDIEQTLLPLSTKERIGRYLGPGFGALVGHPAAEYRLNVKEAHSRAFAEALGDQNAYKREIYKHQQYVKDWTEAAHASGAIPAGKPLPKGVRDALALRGRREAELAAFKKKVKHNLSPREVLTADVGTLVNMKKITPQQASHIVKASYKMTDDLIKQIDRNVREAYFGGSVLSTYRAALNAVLRAKGMQELTTP